MTATKTLSDFVIIPGYDSEWGDKNFLDADGQPIAGIYSDVDNDDYHAIPALSSSKLKAFLQSPSYYYRKYVHPINRVKTASSERSLNAGTVIHGLVLEPERTKNLWWYHLNPLSLPLVIETVDQIKAAIIAKGGQPKGARKEDLIAQLLAVDPEAPVYEELNRCHILSWLKTKNLSWMQVDIRQYPGALTTTDEIRNEIIKLGHEPKSDDPLELAWQLKALSPSIEIILLRQEELLRNVHKTKEYIEYVDKWVLDPVLYDDAMRANNTVRNHYRANSLLSDGIAELTIIAKDAITGLWLKAKLDWLRFDLLPADLKSARDTSPDRWAYQARDLGYDIQDAFYCYVGSLLGMHFPAFPFVCVEFADMDNCEVFEIGPNRRAQAKKDMLAGLLEFKECSDSGFWYGYNKDQTTMVLEW